MSRSAVTRDDYRQAGVALVLVLWTMAVLVALAGEFARAMRQEAQSTQYLKQSTTAQYQAIAGLNEAILAVVSYNGELDEDIAGEDDDGEPAEDAEDGDESSADSTESQSEEDEEQSLAPILSLLEGRGQWIRFPMVPQRDAAPVEVELRATAENGKIPINATSVVDSVFLKQIMLNLGYEVETAQIVADSISDWRDENDLHEEFGAEDQYYESLQRPYHSKDGPFDSLEELLLVRGVTREMFYGHDEVPGLRDIFTVFSRRGRLLEPAVSDEVRYALCGPPPDEEDSFGAPDDGVLAAPALSDCIPDSPKRLGIGGTRTTRPFLGSATVESRVRDGDGEVLAHLAAVINFSRDGFRTLRWYDAMFSSDGS